VSEASRAYHEKRNAVSMNAGFKPKLYGISVSGLVWVEPDYLSIGGQVALTGDFNDKLITPRIAYGYSHDKIGRNFTPYKIFEHDLDTQSFEAGLTFVMSPTVLLVLSGTLDLERGDQSKPYRYVPMFDPTIAAEVPVGATSQLVNLYRLNFRPLEQLPLERNRYAVGIRLAKRFAGSTARLDERVYYDSWQTKSSTTDFRYILDMTERLRVWPHGRLNVQTGTNFYQLAYAAQVDPNNLGVSVPTYRTDDRELAPLLTFTGGGGARLALGKETAPVHYAVTLQGDVMYTRFFESLFVTTRTALYGSLGFEAEFE
jgi:hypothetical protein